MKRVSFVLVAAGVVLGCNGQLIAAEREKFPLKNPAFSFVPPNGYEMERVENKDLIYFKRANGLLIAMHPEEKATDDISARKVALWLLHLLVQGRDIQFTTPETENVGELSITSVKARGNIGGSYTVSDITRRVVLFSPKKGRYFCLTTELATDEVDDWDAFEALLYSIKPE